MDAETNKPWWKRHRWRLVLAAWFALPVAYARTFCPAAYCDGRGWIGHGDFEDFYSPLIRPAVRWRWFPQLEDIFDHFYATGRRATLRQAEPLSPRQLYFLGNQTERERQLTRSRMEREGTP
jgi:hypothetical protein